ncbi:MAG: 3-hydroxyacyl-CoA dehydrogenase [Lactobacillus sp.]|jgi:3-hydroxybutyryl-CoA dehydrogenase|nr:3-hydroxyacyl-CoA dehydrogenase [Lactobacillus sp.]
MFKNIVVAGSGTLGSQIAFQAAYKGFKVVIYDINDDALAKAKERIANLEQTYASEIQFAEKNYLQTAENIQYNSNLLPGLKETFTANVIKSTRDVQSSPDRIRYSKDLKDATAKADLLIEAIPEIIAIKEDFYAQLGKVAPKDTIFATNSSTLLPSQFAKTTGRPEKFLALHFANEIWRNNTAEIMGHAKTDPDVYEQVVEFAKALGMIPIRVQKEQPGYVLNSILIPLLDAAQLLLANEVADPETIDRTWMLATGSPQGPFGILDVVGIQTAYNIVQNYATTTNDEHFKRVATILKTNYLDKGKFGVSSGQGFYTYPNPRFRDPDFLRGE